MATSEHAEITQVPATTREDGVAARGAELEKLLGDPYDRSNPVGFAAVLRADEAAEMPREGERVLRDFGLNAEFVPTVFGGRFDRVDGLARVLRTVFRRDATLGLGYGAISFMASVPLWIAGDQEQRGWAASVLLRGGRLAIAHHELAHGNAFVRDEFAAARDRGGFLLSGSKQVINNAGRADGFVLFARTDPGPGSRSHSVLLVDPARLPHGKWRSLPRYETVGLRGCQLAGLEFTDCPVPRSALVGPAGEGLDVALRCFQVTRSVIPSMIISVAGSALRTVVRYAVELGQARSMGDVPQARSTIGGALADLYICDCLSLVATRAVHFLPGESSVYSAAAKYLVPKILQETLYDLSIVLGSRWYHRDGDYGIFQKQVRDLPVIGLGHAGSASCQATIVPQLPRLARSAWFASPEAPAGLFQPQEDVPPLRFDALAPAARQDSLSAALAVAAGSPAGDHGEPGRVVHDIGQRMVGELRELRRLCEGLSTLDRGTLASPASFALADRYALVLAASAVINVWRHNRESADGFLADPSWAAAALQRLARRLGQPLPDLPPGVAERMHSEAVDRHERRRSYDMYETPLGG